MIWLKRLSPLVLLVLLWFGYQWYTQNQESSADSEARRMAGISAQVWVATAKYRTEPEVFLKYRDSLLGAVSVTRAGIREYITSLDRDPDRQWLFATYLNRAVDSLTKFEDSLRIAASNPQSLPLPPGALPSKVARDSLSKLMDQKKKP